MQIYSLDIGGSSIKHGLIKVTLDKASIISLGLPVKLRTPAGLTLSIPLYVPSPYLRFESISTVTARIYNLD